MSTRENDTPTPQKMTSVEIFSKNICGSGDNLYNPAHAKDSVQTSVIPEIKIEPPEDINDIGDASNFSDNSFSDQTDGPKIRVTPTNKLMPLSNTVDPKRKFTCPYDNCTKSYGKSSHLRSHLTWHTGLKPYVCSELNCGKGFTRSDELNRHIRTHTGEKPFECIQCTKKFSRSDHLTKHLATHVKQMQNKSDGLKKQRKDGNLSPIKRDLEECGTTNGIHFMASIVENISQMDSTKEEIKNFSGKSVLENMPIKIKLERPENCDEYHVVHASMPPRIEQSAVMSEVTLPIPNDIKHVDTNGIRIPADTWPETGIQRVGHDGLRPWRCNLCKKTFKRQEDLNRHLRTHTGDKPFLCVECNKRFKRNDHLKNHLKTHISLR